MAYNAWKQAQNQLGSGESSSDGGSSEGSESSYDPATAKLPNDNAQSSGSAGQDHGTSDGGGGGESDLSQLPRSDSYSTANRAMEGGASSSFDDIEQQLGAALQNEAGNNTGDSNPSSPPQEPPNQNTNEVHESPKKTGLGMAATIAAQTAHTGKTAGLAGKIVGKALANSGKQAFVNGFKACMTPNTNSLIGRANHVLKFSAPKIDKP